MGIKPRKPSVILDILNHHLLPPSGLDYVAYTPTQGREVMMKDLKAAHSTQPTVLLRNFALGKRTVTEQVRLWEELMPVVHAALFDLDRSFVRTGQGENVRVVFDIDMGAFYYTRIGSHAFLFGATLNQAHVNNRKCEEEMQSIATEIATICTAHGA